MIGSLLALSTVATILIAVGCVLIVAAAATVAIVFFVKKRHESRLSMEYLLKLGEKSTEEQPKAEEQVAAASDGQAPAAQKVTTSFFGFRTFLLNKSFTAKLIQLDDIAKEWYSMLKNELLSYKKVRDRMSWKRESFRLGRKCAARFVIRGKRLCLQLNADAAKYAGTKYRVEDLSHVKSSADTPCLYRIKTERRAQYAKDLIADVMAELGAEKFNRTAENYVLPYEETEELIARGLIKKLEVVIPAKEGDEELNTFVEDEAKANVHGVQAAATPDQAELLELFDDGEFDEEEDDEPEEEEETEEPVAEETLAAEAEEEPKEEVEEPAEPAEEEPQQEIAAAYDEYIEEDFEDEEEDEEEQETEVSEPEPEEEPEEETFEEATVAAEETKPAKPAPKEVHYDKSFTAKVIQLSNTSKRWYSKLKNEILSYGKICDVMSWKRESFRLGEDYVVRFIVRGKTLCLLLALDPVKYGEAKYRVQDVSKRHACEDTPCMLRLKNERSVKNALHLIAEAMKKAGTKKVPHAERDYYIPYKTTSQLIEEGLVRSSK